MPAFRKKPVVIEAIQWDGSIESGERIAMSFGASVDVHAERNDPRPPRLAIATIEGVMTAKAGDWIIQGVKGEIYPCRADIFAATYDAA